MLQFRATELMTGQHHFVDPALGAPSDQPCHFRLTWGGPASQMLNPLRRAAIRYDAAGTIHFSGLTAGDVPCRGTIAIDYARAHQIDYDLAFDVGGTHYRFHGEKTGVNPLRPIELVKTHTTCYGTLATADGRVVSRSVIHFLPETLSSFVKSFRLGLRAALPE